MNYTGNIILYPLNRALETAVSDSRDLLTAEQSEFLFPDRSVAIADNFLHTRGNYEQLRFSTRVYQDMSNALQAVLTEDLRASKPLEWAEAQNRLGNILGGLGQLQHDTALYERAVNAFNCALEVYSQENTPLEWAETQANLATALQAQGRLMSDAKLLNKAVDAYTAALLVYTKKDHPEAWKLVMIQQGISLHSYGLLLKGNRTFQKSVVAYKNAIAELDADNYAFELAAAHNNCGAALHNLAESEENPARFEEAIRSYEKGWTVCMEQQLPVHLSVLCRINKSTARGVLAELTNDIRLADDVADEFEIILECFPHALQPLCAQHCEAQKEKMRALATAGNR
ncbi:MAG: tetratricopeptide repeat protein [Gammaproteobacteria bacterium]|nr:tetratricopeptide repeat protein [Gammaproteobacteria bacterium]MDH5651808.1 tetratricopeptide repeat protein [Gammaproteobacteria bacterium]